MEERRGAYSSAVALLVVSLAVCGAYVFTGAPLYNEVGTIDPWLYTALWTNFHQIFTAFSTTYYVSRVPWIVPGYVLNSIMGAKAAFWVLHVALFFGGGLLLFVLARRRLGLLAAITAYVALIGDQIYFDAHRWDYEEGGVVFLVIAAAVCAAWRPQHQRRDLLPAFLFGACAAALGATRIVDVVYLVGMLALYWAARAPLTRAEWKIRLTRDAAAFVAGAFVLLFACGVFSNASGGRFLFFRAQFGVIFSSAGEGNQLPVHAWLPTDPAFFAPFMVVVLGVIVALKGTWVSSEARRLQLASTVWLGISLVIVAGWEFLGNGFVFELVYYFSSLVPPTALCLGASVAALVPGPRRLRSTMLALVVLSVSALAPLPWFFRGETLARFPSHYGDTTYLLPLAGMCGALALAALGIARRALALGLAAAALMAFSTSFAFDGSLGTRFYASGDPRPGPLYSLGQDLIGYLHANGFSHDLPRFWYQQTDEGGIYISLQSLYYYSYTLVGVNMPAMDADFRARMDAFKPSSLVLLCSVKSCSGGPPALRRAGFEPKLAERTHLARGSLDVWVEIYRLLKPPTA